MGVGLLNGWSLTCRSVATPNRIDSEVVGLLLDELALGTCSESAAMLHWKLHIHIEPKMIT